MNSDTTNMPPNFITSERVEIAVHATLDVAPCLQEALRILAGEGARGMMPDDHAVLRALLLRAYHLVDVTMEALNEEDAGVEQMRDVLSGVAF